MKNVILKFRKVIFFEMPISLLILNLGISPCYSAEQEISASAIDEIAALKKPSIPPPPKTPAEEKIGDTYTINFNNVSIIEYIKFISKIANINFVFDEQELQFTVTIVSEEPISKKNILSALVQVLRIHGLRLLEQENNFLITKSTEVNQISTLVSPDMPNNAGQAPIVTRVFRIKNANPNSIASIIRPMTSAAALIEVSLETRQLIVTDITTNVDKISTLLLSIDSPHSPLEIESFVAKNIPTSQLVTLATQILSPFAEGNPLIFVPQTDTNTLFIVSTPYLIERAITLLEDLDSPTKGTVVGKPLTEQNVFLYKIQSKSPQEIQSAIKQIAAQLALAPSPQTKLIDALNQANYIKESNSLLFTGDNETLAKVKEILSTIDIALGIEAAAHQIFLYKLKYASREQMDEALTHLASGLDLTNASDKILGDVIQGRTWIKDSNSFLFKGDTATINRLKEILSVMDNPEGIAGEKQTFYLYQLEHSQGDIVKANLENVAENLARQGPSNQPVIDAIHNVKWIKDNNSLLLTGTEGSVEQVKKLIAGFDVQGAALHPSKSSFFIYKPKHRTPEQIEASLRDVAQDLHDSGLIDPGLLETISTMRYTPSTHSLVFTGTTTSIDKVKELLETIDVASAEGPVIQKIGKLTFLIYKLQNASANQLMSSLKAMEGDLQKQGALDPDLAQVLSSMRWIKETNSILFTGPESGLQKAEELAQRFDVRGLPSEEQIPRETPTNFFLYKPLYRTGPELISILCDFQQNLIHSGVADKGLMDAIGNLKWIERTGNLLISGDEPSIAKVQELLQKFDVPTLTTGAAPSIELIDNTSFLVYKLQYHKGEEIQSALKQIASELGHSKREGSPAHMGLVDAINSLQWIKITNSLIATGEQDTLTKVRDLIQNLDVPLRQVFIEVLVIETSLSNSQNFGLQWGGKAQYLNKLGMGTGNFPILQSGAPGSPGPIPLPVPGGNTFSNNLGLINATTTPTGASVPFFNGFDLGVIGDIILHKGKTFLSLGSLVNAVEQDTDSTVVLNPKILTQDNNNSTIFVGSNIPFVGSVVNVLGSSTSSTTSLEYRDIGLNLSITPVLGNNDIVTLDIQNDISELTQGAPTITVGSVSGITTAHTSMSTKVHVPNKNFLVLSGMIRDQKARAVSKIPCLGGLPVIGAAFSENDISDTKQNIIIFIRPQIIENFDQYKEITDHQENLYKENAVLPILKEQFDQALDLVKTPENE